MHPEEEMDQCDTMGRKIGSRLDPTIPFNSIGGGGGSDK